MRCWRCGLVPEEDDIYCRKCGTRLKLIKNEEFCSCGEKIAEGVYFCPKCGKQIIPS